MFTRVKKRRSIKRQAKKALLPEFRMRVAKDIGTRGAILLIAISFILIVVLAVQVLESVVFDWGITVWRIVVVIICLPSAFIARSMVKRLDTDRKVNVLRIFIAVLHFSALFVGVGMTVYLSGRGLVTYSNLMLALAMIMLTSVERPEFMIVISSIMFVSLSIHIVSEFGTHGHIMTEISTAGIFLTLMGLASTLSRNRAWDMFLQEKRINEINAQLKDMSEHDPLTGLFNRNRTVDELERQIERSKRYGEPFCVAIMDLDFFKKINDTYGHNAGDRVLNEFSQKVGRRLRASDIFGRWGGEEFIIIIPQTDIDDAYKMMENIRKQLENHHYSGIGRITFSAGICQYDGHQTSMQIIDNADHALYDAKKLGRNRVKACEREQSAHGNGSA